MYLHFYNLHVLWICPVHSCSSLSLATIVLVSRCDGWTCMDTKLVCQCGLSQERVSWGLIATHLCVLHDRAQLSIIVLRCMDKWFSSSVWCLIAFRYNLCVRSEQTFRTQDMRKFFVLENTLIPKQPLNGLEDERGQVFRWTVFWLLNLTINIKHPAALLQALKRIRSVAPSCGLKMKITTNLTLRQYPTVKPNNDRRTPVDFSSTLCARRGKVVDDAEWWDRG